MRGAFEDQGRLFSYISPGTTGRGTAPAPYNTRADARGARRAGPRLPQAVFNDGAPVDPARTVAERTAAASVLRHTK